jgi:hypothetical protein
VNGACQFSLPLCLGTDRGVVVPGCISPLKLFLLHTKRPHVPLVLPLCVDPVEEAEKAHIVHPVETGTTTARRREVLRESSGHNLLVLVEAHPEIRADVCAGIEHAGCGIGSVCHVLLQSLVCPLQYAGLCYVYHPSKSYH